MEQGKTKVLCDTLGLEEGQIGLVCLYCERFEPRSHFKRLSLIVQVNVVLNRTVVVDSDWRFDNLCGSHLQSQSELYHALWWNYTLVIDLIGQLCRDVISRLPVKPWCYWLWRLIISNWCVLIRLLSQLNSDWGFDNLCGSHLQSQSKLNHVSWWYYTLVIDLIGQLCRDVIGRLSRCYWLWRLVISN